MAVQRMAVYTPPSDCWHEATTRLSDGSQACVECGYHWPAPKEPEWVRRMHEGQLRTKDLTGTNGWSESELRAAWGDR